MLDRVLLLYEAGIRKFSSNEDFDPGLISQSAEIIRDFIDNYHEKSEEEHVFPRFKKAGRRPPASCAPGCLSSPAETFVCNEAMLPTNAARLVGNPAYADLTASKYAAGARAHEAPMLLESSGVTDRNKFMT